MASIIRQGDGRRAIQFKGLDGKRKTLRLGRCDRKTAETVKTKIEALAVAAVSGGTMDDETAAWVRKIADSLADKLAAFGLIQRRAGTGADAASTDPATAAGTVRKDVDAVVASEQAI